MHRLPGLVFFSRVLVQLFKWLDKNYARLSKELKSECPDAPVAWIQDQIILNAFEAGF